MTDSIAPAAPATTTISIRGMTYSVERFVRQRHGNTELAYRLTGVRGAKYETIRNVPRPELMFLVYSDRFGIADILRGVWLSDKGGELKVVRP